MKYVIISSEDKYKVVSKVEELGKDGWQLRGELSVVSHKEASDTRAYLVFTQVMTRNFPNIGE